MFRLQPSRIELDDADVANIINSTSAIYQARALGSPFQSPRLATQTAAVEDPLSSSSESSLPPLSADLAAPINNMASGYALNVPTTFPQLPYTHLPYGPEREEIVTSNLHTSHLDHLNAQLNAQTAVSTTLLNNLSARHTSTTNHLLGQLHTTNTQIKIYDWRHAVTLDTTNEAAELEQATDLLLSKYADLRSPTLRSLADVKAAESAFEPGRNTDMDPPISSILGVEGGSNVPSGAPAHLRRLYGNEADVAVVLRTETGEDVRFGDGEDARSVATTSTTTNATSADLGRAEHGAVNLSEDVGPADAGVADGGLTEEAQDGVVGADARGAAVEVAKPRHRLLGKLKKTLRI